MEGEEGEGEREQEEEEEEALSHVLVEARELKWLGVRGPGFGEKYKRDNLLGPEAAEACFHDTYKPVVHDAASARAGHRGCLDTALLRASSSCCRLAREDDGAAHGGHTGYAGEGADLVTCESSRVTRES